MGSKTSHRRKHLKIRDPMAAALESNLFHQRRVEKKRHDDQKWRYSDEEND